MDYCLSDTLLWKFQLRFGKVNKYISNTNVFEHSGKFYSIAENHIPQEIDIFTLKTLGNWNPSAWNRPFTGHPKVHSCCKLNNFLFIQLDFHSVYLNFCWYITEISWHQRAGYNGSRCN